MLLILLQDLNFLANTKYHSQTWFKIYRDDKGKYEYAGNNCGLINPFHSSTFIVIVIIIIITILIITIAMKDISWISLQVRTSLIWLCESVTRPEYQNSCTYKLTERGNVKNVFGKKKLYKMYSNYKGSLILYPRTYTCKKSAKFTALLTQQACTEKIILRPFPKDAKEMCALKY